MEAQERCIDQGLTSESRSSSCARDSMGPLSRGLWSILHMGTGEADFWG